MCDGIIGRVCSFPGFACSRPIGLITYIMGMQVGRAQFPVMGASPFLRVEASRCWPGAGAPVQLRDEVGYAENWPRGSL